MTRLIIILIALALTGCAAGSVLGGALLLHNVRQYRNPTCPPDKTIQRGTYAGFCDRRDLR